MAVAVVVVAIVDTLDDFSWVCYFVDGLDRNHLGRDQSPVQLCTLLTKTRPTLLTTASSSLLPISSTTTSTTMGLFNRKKQHNDDADGQNGERKKEKGSWRRPASKSFARQVIPSLTAAPVLSRYRFQATASESMAANSYPQNSLAYTLHHRYHIRPNRRSARVGKQLGMPSIHSRFISLTFFTCTPIISSSLWPSGSYRCLK